MVAARGEVHLVSLDPTHGHPIKKTRPCLVVSPDEMNRVLSTVIVAPMTTKGRSLPMRVPITFQKKTGLIVLDQIRTVDRVRLVRRLGSVTDATLAKVLAVLGEMFAFT
jgi:mRNA interferase MazF